MKHIGHHIAAIGAEGRARPGPQGDMQNGAAFGGIDGLTCEHRIPLGLKPGGAGKAHEIGEGSVIQQVFRIIERDAAGGGGKAVETLRIGGE